MRTQAVGMVLALVLGGCTLGSAFNAGPDARAVPYDRRQAVRLGAAIGLAEYCAAHGIEFRRAAVARHQALAARASAAGPGADTGWSALERGRRRGRTGEWVDGAGAWFRIDQGAGSRAAWCGQAARVVKAG